MDIDLYMETLRNSFRTGNWKEFDATITRRQNELQEKIDENLGEIEEDVLPADS